MNAKFPIRLVGAIVLGVFMVVLALISPEVGPGIQNAGISPNSILRLTATEQLQSAVCEVYEDGGIAALLSNSACTNIMVHAGDYRHEGLYKIERSGITLEADGEAVIAGIIIYGNNNVVRGFTITDPNQKTGIRTYGDNNLVEKNEIYNTAEDGMWLWGKNNVIRGNYIHDIYDDRDWPAYDQHVDCFMTFSWQWPVEDLLLDSNLCVLDRSHGSNQFFILTHEGEGPMRNITFRNNVFIANDAGYVPIALFGDADVTGIRIINNTFYNTSGQGEDAVWAENMPDVYIANNAIIGYGSVVRIVGSNVVEEKNVVRPPYGMSNIPDLDFRLLPGSPLINTGIPLGIEHDFDGNPRDEWPDIGAFEYQAP